ncbi:MAG: 4Fe-4S ferredoxin [Proteobacteria bacterium]|nr:4Fe-4S ferredoxin [Pseudomonadota bacterium]
MKFIKINKKDWEKGLEQLGGTYRLFGPVKDKDSHDFKEIDQGEAVATDLMNSRLSPKAVVYPQSETMFEYTLDEEKDDHNIMKEVAVDTKPKAVLGVRPCDAASFLLVKRNFDNPEYPDPFWISSYEASTFVGLACDDPDSTCFCTSVGSGPYAEEGMDILLIKDGTGFVAKVMTTKGGDLAHAAGWAEDAGSVDVEAMRKKAEAKISTTVATDKLKQQELNDLFNAPFWDDAAFACLNCGTCTFSCPTCWCFDIQDENLGLDGKRMRNWDSCMFPLFTLEGSGHNPRPQKVQRVRQRFMHKLKYYVDKYDAGVQCVGCGRCIRLCPVNIDIRNVCEQMNSYQSA